MSLAIIYDFEHDFPSKKYFLLQDQVMETKDICNELFQ